MKIDPPARPQTIQPEQREPAKSTEKNNPIPSTQQVFSPNHLPGVTTPKLVPDQPPGLLRVADHQGLGLFDRSVFSQPFAHAYRAAKAAIQHPENREHMAKTGAYSPTAKAAVDRFTALVAAKSAETTASSAARSSFLEGPLNKFEMDAWMAFVAKLPASYTNEVVPASSWKKIDVEEMRSVLANEPAFGQFLDKPQGARFVHELTHAVNAKSAEMLSTDKGFALVFRFDNTYGTAGHTALASLWRGEQGELRMGITHQESVPGNKASGGVFTGVVHDTFDTSATYPGGKAPAIESIKLAGLPSVNVFPCPRPEAIVAATAEIAGQDKAHPYGATDNWNESKRGTLPDGRPFETCFTVTHKVLAQLYNAKTSPQPTLPHVLVAMRPFASMPEEQFQQVSIGSGKSAKTVNLQTVEQQSAGEIVQVFKTVAEQWGLYGSWDVSSQSRSSKSNVVFSPDQKGFNLPDGARHFKFISQPAHLTLNGKPVLAGPTYTREEAAEMVYTGKEKSKPALVVSTVFRQAKL